MKQEYHFTISRTDRIYLILFVGMLMSWELIKNLIPVQPVVLEITPPVIEPNQEQPVKKTKNTSTKSKRKDYQFNQAWKKEVMEYEEFISPVRIMEASYDELRHIGLSSKVASNIKKYITAGGVIKNDVDLIKIYGMDSIQLDAATPYIIYPQKDPDTKSHFAAKAEHDFVKEKKIIDLNKATMVELESLAGIGPVLAERIIKFRDGLGGFFQVDQLKDCYGLPPETFEKIFPSLEISTPPSLIMINEIDLNAFTHPYLHKRFSRLMKAYRDQHGPFRNVSDLRRVYPPDSTWCEKILPYISLEIE